MQKNGTFFSCVLIRLEEVVSLFSRVLFGGAKMDARNMNVGHLRVLLYFRVPANAVCSSFCARGLVGKAS